MTYIIRQKSISAPLKASSMRRKETSGIFFHGKIIGGDICWAQVRHCGGEARRWGRVETRWTGNGREGGNKKQGWLERQDRFFTYLVLCTTLGQPRSITISVTSRCCATPWTKCWDYVVAYNKQNSSFWYSFCKTSWYSSKMIQEMLSDLSFSE